MKFVVTKTADQLDLQALHRVRERLVSLEYAKAIDLRRNKAIADIIPSSTKLACAIPETRQPTMRRV